SAWPAFCAEISWSASFADRADRRGCQMRQPAWLILPRKLGVQVSRTFKRVRMPRLRAFAAMVGLVLFVGAAGSWSEVSASSMGKSISLSSVYWIFYKEDFNHLHTEDPALIKQVAAGPGTYVLEQRAGGIRLPRNVIPVQYFFSSAGLQAAIGHHQVIPGVKVVADDLENFAVTPAAERKNPIPALREFGDTARAKGYRSILMPGRDLMRVPGAVCSQRP